MQLIKKKDLKTEFLPSALEIIETPASPLGQITIWLIFTLIMGAIIWSVVSQVDEVAVARGKVVPDGNIKVIQSLDGGVITAIYVTEGEKVQKGQLLIELDTDLSITELEKNKAALETARIEREFLNALLNGNDDKAQALIEENKGTLLTSEVLERQQRFKDIKEQDFIEQQRMYQLNYEKTMDELNMSKQQLKQSESKVRILQEQTDIQKKLYENGAVPEQEYIDKANELEFAIQERDLQETKISYYESQLALSANQKATHGLDNGKDILKELVEKDKEILELEKEVAKLEKQLEFQIIKSPVNGTVQGVGANTIGGVVTSGNPIVSIVPDATPLVIEASVLNKDIGFISLGQEVDIKLDTFPYQKYGTLPGEIINISPDATEDEQLGYVYKIKVKPLQSTIHVDTRDVGISSGMTVMAEVKTGKRKVVEFFLPAIQHIKDSFKLR